MEVTQPGAHIDHMLRQTRMHNMQLSTMADMKANLLLTISSLVLGLSLTHLRNSIENFAFIILCASSLGTISLAIYATMPKAGPMGLLKKKQYRRPKYFTLLFFGDYANLTYEEYEKEMEVTMNSPSLTYEVQVRELYNMGVYLAKHKYQKLRLAYLVFLSGIISAVVVYFFQYLI